MIPCKTNFNRVTVVDSISFILPYYPNLLPSPLVYSKAHNINACHDLLVSIKMAMVKVTFSIAVFLFIF